MAFIDNISKKQETTGWTFEDLFALSLETAELSSELNAAMTQLTLLNQFKTAVTKYGYNESIHSISEGTGLRSILESEYGIISGVESNKYLQTTVKQDFIKGCENMISDAVKKVLALIASLVDTLKTSFTKALITLLDKSNLVDNVYARTMAVPNVQRVELEIEGTSSATNFIRSFVRSENALERLSSFFSSMPPTEHPDQGSAPAWTVDSFETAYIILKRDKQVLNQVRIDIPTYIKKTEHELELAKAKVSEEDMASFEQLSKEMAKAHTALIKDLGVLMREYAYKAKTFNWVGKQFQRVAKEMS